MKKAKVPSAPKATSRVFVAVRMPDELFQKFKAIAHRERRPLGAQALSMIERVMNDESTSA